MTSFIQAKKQAATFYFSVRERLFVLIWQSMSFLHYVYIQGKKYTIWLAYEWEHVMLEMYTWVHVCELSIWVGNRHSAHYGEYKLWFFLGIERGHMGY